MSLASALAASKVTPGPRCTVCLMIEKLGKDDRAALLAALADASFTGAAIARALKSEGHSISAQSLQRHRKSECAK